MLVVAKGLLPHQGTLIVGFVKTASLVGVYIGGLCSDKLGMKFTVMISFFLTTFGLGVLPLPSEIYLIVLLAVIAQVGNSMFPSAARLMLAELLGAHRLKEGYGWYRLANNLGQIVSYTLSATFAYLGIMFFFYFDALTTLIAMLLGIYVLPDLKTPSVVDKTNHLSSRTLFTKHIYKNKSIFLFVIASLIVALFLMCFEMIVIGVSAKSSLVFGNRSLRIFSTFMVINTILCAIFAIPASKYFKNLKHVFVAGILILVSAGILSLQGRPTEISLFLGAFLWSLSEIIFASMSQYSLILFTPENTHKGTFYSFSIILQRIGVVIAGFIAMPLTVYGNYAIYAFTIIGIVTLALIYVLMRTLRHPEIKEKFNATFGLGP